MSPLVILVFGPVLLLGFVGLALLVGAAGAGAWEAVETRDAVPPVLRDEAAAAGDPGVKVKAA